MKRSLSRLFVMAAVCALVSGVLASASGTARAMHRAVSTTLTGTTTDLTSDLNPSAVGQSVTFTATVSPTSGSGTPTGTVHFYDGDTPAASPTLVNGVATWTTSALIVGDHDIHTYYDGDGTFDASSAEMTGNPQVVNPGDTTTALMSSLNPSVAGEPVTFTATVSASAPASGTPTGTVTFLDNGNQIGQPVQLAAGVAQLTTSALTAGNHTITTSYAGDGSFNGSTGSLTGNPQVVSTVDTTTTLASSANPVVAGEFVQFTATVTPDAPSSGTPTGPVELLEDGIPVDDEYLYGGTATFYVYGLTAGDHTFEADYQGDGSYNASNGQLAGNPEVVTPADTTTTVTSSLNPSADGIAVTFTATVDAVSPGGGDPTGTVTFLDGGNPIGTGDIDGDQATFTTSDLAVGDHTITASYAGDSNYNASNGSLTNNPEVVDPYPIQGAIQDLAGCRDNTFPANDDGYTGPVDVGFSPSFDGLDFSQVYVNNNGNVTIGQGLSTYTPYDFTLQTLPLIGPYFADVDTRGQGSLPVTYGTDTLDGHPVFCVNWVNVGFYFERTDLLNSFQLLLIDRSDIAPGDFDIEFNYGTINWETGNASGGVNGFGGVPARAGWTNGDGDPNDSYTFPGSGISMSLEDSNDVTGLIHGSLDQDPTLGAHPANITGVLGRYIFAIRNLPPTGSTLQGTVSDHDGFPVSGSTVQICDANENCQVRQTDSDGMYTVKNLGAGSYTVTAGPGPFSNDTPGTGGPIAVDGTVPPGGVFTQNVTLGPAPGAPPDGTSVPSAISDNDGIPVVYWENPLSLETHGCVNGSATYQVIVEGNVVRSGDMTETPLGSGTYIADNIRPLYPNHGNAQVTMTIVCPDPNDNQDIDFGMYIDPSGKVTDADTGQPIAGATVTLLRSDSADGPFIPVPNGSTIMSADNRTNPSTTGSDGAFAWDVVAGYYEIQASKSGCNTATSDVLTIPPPVTNLDIQLECGSTPAPQLSVTLAGGGSGWVTSSPDGIDCVTGTCSLGFTAGTQVTLTASTDAHATFTGWSGGGCSGTGTCQVTLNGDTSVTANFSPVQHTLQVGKSGDGSGTVTSDVGGITCGNTCQAQIDDGTQVKLTPAADAGSIFTGWTGGGCEAAGTNACTVTVTADTTVTANFAVADTLTVDKAGSGSGTVTSNVGAIDCGGVCSDQYADGTVVTLTAAPDAGSDFSKWTGATCEDGPQTATQCKVDLAGDTTVTANFLKQYTLTAAKAGTGSGNVTSDVGGIDCGATCAGVVDDGTMVTLTATPDAGSAFTGWSGGGCSGTGTCQVTVTNDTTVTATFVPTHTLTVQPAGTGSGTVTSDVGGIDCGSTCDGVVNDGTVVTLTATAGAGSVFTGWSGGGCTGTAPCPVTVTADTTVTATFSLIQCVVPNVKGKTLTAARSAITKAHCAVGKVGHAASKKVAKGKVISQSPPAGKHLKKGSKVNLVVSKGKH